MTLREYIAAGHATIAQIGSHFNVSDHGVRKWMYGQRSPDLDTALEIEVLTGGRVTVADLSKTRAAEGAGRTQEAALDVEAIQPDHVALCPRCRVRAESPQVTSYTSIHCPLSAREAA